MEAIAVSGKSSLFALLNWWPQSIYKTRIEAHTGVKIRILSENSHVQNHIIQEIHIFKIELAKFLIAKSYSLTKIALVKSNFSQKSHFQSHFRQNYILEAIFVKITFSKYCFSQNSYCLKYQSQVNIWQKVSFCPSV